MKRTGFSLIELMTVVAIIGLLAVIAIPKLANLKGRAQVAAMKSDLRNLVTLQENYFAQHLKYATATGRDLAGFDWYQAFSAWKLAIVLEASYVKHLRGESTNSRHAFQEYVVDQLLDAPRLAR